MNILDYTYYDDSSLDANQTTGFDSSKITHSRHRIFRSVEKFFGEVTFSRYLVFGDATKIADFCFLNAFRWYLYIHEIDH